MQKAKMSMVFRSLSLMTQTKFHSLFWTTTGITRPSFQYKLLNASLCLYQEGGEKRHLHRSSSCMQKSPETPLLRDIQAKIRFNGPITIAEYMKEVLTNPAKGYYMQKDVFGTSGDFTTSPEISQMFGELLGIWCIHEWMEAGSPDSVQVVELGPGRGTLADDILRTFSQFDAIKNVCSWHLVEVSPKMIEMQRDKLTHQSSTASSNSSTSASVPIPDSQSGISRYGPQVNWYNNLKDVPRGFSIYVAHEFFDALPIHKFQKKDGAWHEVMVDIDETEEGPHHLRLVLSRSHTAADSLLFQVAESDTREHIEQSPESAIICQEIASRIAEDGGAALLADYGHSGEKTDTFRGFRKHAICDALSEPGMADLTADVDFRYLQNMVDDKVSTYGPITQSEFLHNMGIGVRLKKLFERADSEQRKNLITGYDMLTNPEKMGERFKFFAMMKHRQKEYQPAGFKNLH